MWRMEVFVMGGDTPLGVFRLKRKAPTKAEAERMVREEYEKNGITIRNIRFVTKQDWRNRYHY